MALRFADSRGDIFMLPISNWTVNGGEITAHLTNSEIGINSIINYPLPIIKELEDYSSCKIFLFKNRFQSKEDHCYNVSIEKKRKGVIFPIKIYSNPSVLPTPASSNEAGFLYRFLHIAFNHLLDCKSLPSKAISYENLSNPDLRIEDFYDEETVIFLYHDEKKGNLDIKECYPSLLKSGYVPILSEIDFKEIEMIIQDPDRHPLYSQSLLNTIEVEKVKSNIIEEKFIEQIFSSVLKYPLTPLSRFILLYQVVELLIDKIALQYYQSHKPFDTSMSVLMITADRSKSYRDTFTVLKDIITRINKSFDKVREEDKRISILFNEKCKLQMSDYIAFTSFAQKIVGAARVCKDLPDFVYQLRNKIIHDYHNLTLAHSDIDQLMLELNVEFEKLIADTIIAYN